MSNKSCFESESEICLFLNLVCPLLHLLSHLSLPPLTSLPPSLPLLLTLTLLHLSPRHTPTLSPYHNFHKLPNSLLPDQNLFTCQIGRPIYRLGLKKNHAHQLTGHPPFRWPRHHLQIARPILKSSAESCHLTSIWFRYLHASSME